MHASEVVARTEALIPALRERAAKVDELDFSDPRSVDIINTWASEKTHGNISSIALNAAFMAAESGKPVTMPAILSAARTELRKLAKPFNEAEFR